MIAHLAAVSLFAAPALNLGPPPEIKREPQVIYLDRSGRVIGVRGGRYAPPVDLNKLPAYVPAAFVAIEDRRFYEHAGFDPVGIARAIVTDLARGSAREGASTITQQLAKNVYLNADRTVERKAEELLLAVKLERTYSKKQILGLYLSRVYFGSGAYGLEAAATRYFNTSAAHLTLREAATLAALMKSPTHYNPIDQPAASAARTGLVLDTMVETAAITPADRARALKQSPKVWRTAASAPAQYFVDWVDAQARQRLGRIRQDVVVETTLDAGLETAAANQAGAVVTRFKPQGASQAAVVVLEGSGAVRVLVGGLDYAASPFNRAIDAHRQAGSSWKPFVYLTAMEAGRTPDTAVIDEPVTINGWSPHNYEPEFLGPTTLEQALIHSVNTVAARLADEVGRDAVAATARRLGITSPINTDPAMALGTTLVTPIEMAQAYDSFANGGNRAQAYAVERIRLAGGAVIYQRPATGAPVRVIANPALSEMHRMLRGVVASGTGVRAGIPGHDLAGKTGTTSDYKDAWFCGFTGGLTAVVWMGRDDAGPMRRITGGGAPAEIWRGVMAEAMRHIASGPIPPGPPAPIPAAEPIATPTAQQGLPDPGLLPPRQR